MSGVVVRVLNRGAWHVDLEITDPAFGSALKIATRLCGVGFNARVKDGVVVVDASGPSQARLPGT